MRRYADRAVVCCDRNQAVLRASLKGAPVRMLIGDVIETDPCKSAPAQRELEDLLCAYREPERSALQRARLMRAITELGLRHAVVTPWTALLATASLPAASSVKVPVPAATA